MDRIYHNLGGGYSYVNLNVGMILRNAAGTEIYIQPGDDTNSMHENINAMDEVANNMRDGIADAIFGEYFGRED